MKLNQFTLLLIALMTTSCVTTPHEDNQQAVKQAIDTPESWATQAAQYSDASIKWLETFNDPMMLKLIAEGKAKNFDLQVAAGSMDKAWLLAKQSHTALKPNADLSLGRTDSEAASSSFNVNLQASWELDVWGRIRAGIDATTANAQAAKADYLFAQHSLSANIAKSYLKVIESKLQAEIARKNLSILNKTMRITQVKYDNGLSSGQDIALTRANLATVQEQLIKIEGSQRDALRALEVLLGRYPKADLEIPDTQPELPLPPPAGVPSEILERRPDIVSAERKIASAFNATAETKAARLPKISLTGSLGGSSESLFDLINPANLAWQLASNLLTPLFDGGKRKIDIEIATVEQKQAIANYAQVALTAFSEVENNLDQGTVLANREIALNDALKQSNKAYSIAHLRYREGETELLDTLQIQQQTINAESNLLSIQRTQLEQRINLYLALGGSW